MSLYKVTIVGIKTPFEVEANSSNEAIDKVLTENNLTNAEGDVELLT